jgi:hypothetical protein
VNFLEFASNVSSVAIQYRAVSCRDLTRVVHDDDLSLEIDAFFWWVVLGVTADETSSNILNTQVFNVESNIVSRNSLLECFVMHFD